jgi:hypothetical protein
MAETVASKVGSPLPTRLPVSTAACCDAADGHSMVVYLTLRSAGHGGLADSTGGLGELDLRALSEDRILQGGFRCHDARGRRLLAREGGVQS